jgi:hypothetical protein
MQLNSVAINTSSGPGSSGGKEVVATVLGAVKRSVVGFMESVRISCGQVRMKTLPADAITSESDRLWVGVPRFLGESAFGGGEEKKGWMMKGREIANCEL